MKEEYEELYTNAVIFFKNKSKGKMTIEVSTFTACQKLISNAPPGYLLAVAVYVSV